MGVDPAMVRIYATGGRGYHVEIPQEMFLVKPVKAGNVRNPDAAQMMGRLMGGKRADSKLTAFDQRVNRDIVAVGAVYCEPVSAGIPSIREIYRDISPYLPAFHGRSP